MITLYNEDCLPAMEKMQDNQFDLAIVDPPYGIGFGEFNRTNKTTDGTRVKANKYKQSNWDDSIPTDEYFTQLKRVSKNQIVWGANYFPTLWIKGCKGFIFWYKGNPVPNFSDGELAFTSFNKVAKQFNYRYYGGLEGNTTASNKIHPTQKPIQLYEWILMNYAKEGDKILDTHLGSGSIAIACDNLGYDLTGYELDKDYFRAATKRLKEHQSQIRMF
jgi:site-specific DNA-methyltransferase (adenine-specific)